MVDKLCKNTIKKFLEKLKLENSKLFCPRIEEIGINSELIIFINEKGAKSLIKELSDIIETKTERDSPLLQLLHAASLPCVLSPIVAMPDVHLGYDFPIGSVVKFDLNNKDLRIYPSAIGYDINCGMRLIKTNLKKEVLDKYDRKKLLRILSREINTGKKKKGIVKLKESELENILKYGIEGIEFSEKSNLSTNKNDILGIKISKEKERTEQKGSYKIDLNVKDLISKNIFKQGKNIGSLGSGNHFLEINFVEEIFDNEICKALKIDKETICILIHTGSRNFGYKVIETFIEEAENNIFKGNNKEGILYNSEKGKSFINAYKMACNFAWANRSIISKKCLSVFKSFFNEEIEFELLTDISHNSMDEDFRAQTLTVRKGACKMYSFGHSSLSEDFREIGSAVVVGGSMGTASYLLKPGRNNFCESCCHGAGRKFSRKESKERITKEETLNLLKKEGILISSGEKAIQEESPLAYKCIEEVIRISVENELVEKVMKVKPLLVLKD